MCKTNMLQSLLDKVSPQHLSQTPVPSYVYDFILVITNILNAFFPYFSSHIYTLRSGELTSRHNRVCVAVAHYEFSHFRC